MQKNQFAKEETASLQK